MKKGQKVSEAVKERMAAGQRKRWAAAGKGRNEDGKRGFQPKHDTACLGLSIGSPNVGADIDGDLLEFLKRVDELKKKVKFPSNSQLFAIAREVLRKKA